MTRSPHRSWRRFKMIAWAAATVIIATWGVSIVRCVAVNTPWTNMLVSDGQVTLFLSFKGDIGSPPLFVRSPCYGLGPGRPKPWWFRLGLWLAHPHVSASYLDISMPILVLLAAVGIVGLVLQRRYRKLMSKHCSLCGYDLTGNVSGVCPECGEAVPRQVEILRRIE